MLVHMLMDTRMTIVRNYALLIMLMTAPLAASHAAGLYKWTDEQGTVHYTQIPPTERPAEVITPEPPPPAQPKEQADEEKLPEGLSSADTANLRIRQQNCETARKNLAIYQSSEKVLQPDGTEMVLSNEMREAKIRETQAQIKLYCE